MISLYDLGKLHNAQKDFDHALKFLNEALDLAVETQDKLYQSHCHEAIAQVFKSLGDFEAALQHYEKFYALKSLIFDEENAAKIHNLQILHRTHEAHKEAAIQKRLREQDRAYFERLAQMKDDFISTASHDLKNPLGTMLNGLFLLKKHESLHDTRAQHLLKMMETQISRMRELITDVLDLAKLETGRAVEKKYVLLNSLFNEVLGDFEVVAQEKNIGLFFHPPAHEVYIACDPLRIRQALNNLVSNAIKYTPEGGQVELFTEIRKNDVVIQVRDSGLGIPEKDLPHIFERFYRVEKSTHRKIDGTGLGLSIVKSIIDQHQEQIWVESVEGHGTTFFFTLSRV
jgi:signal transduction histidine kinase